jgi:hypothetical protein
MKIFKDDIFHVGGTKYQSIKGDLYYIGGAGYRSLYNGVMYYNRNKSEVLVVHDDYTEKFNQDDFIDHLKGHGYIEEVDEDDIPLLRKKKLAMWTDVR